jgi:predicted murein hydrolase (TIGR00659 family)
VRPEVVFEIWTYLSAQPLTGLTLTLLAFALAEAFHRRLGETAFTSPVLVAIGLLAVFLTATGTPYERYFDGAQFVHFLLGPATVALAVPLYENLSAVRRSMLAVAVGLAAGSLTAIVSAVGLAWALGAESVILRTVASKSVTTPVAMALTERLGGLPSLTAVLVILTGLVGSVLGGPTLDALRIADPRARGLAYGVAAHGIGTARALTESSTAGAFSSLGMGLNALLTSILLPALAAWVAAGG